jgi:hypothetical protein
MYPKRPQFVLCPQPPGEGKAEGRAARERQANAYWDRLTLNQEGWILRKMRFAEMGAKPATSWVRSN